jgi:outer membrane protein assembly factor BamE (lipoprotein component of BamABCDE complex)
MKNIFITSLVCLSTSFVLGGCFPTSLVEQQKDMQEAKGQGDNISVGKVQREVKVGMSSSDVVVALGSPNMVTTDEKRRETWVYDKVSTEAMVSASSGMRFFWLPADGKAAASTTQKTLTIIIKFDEKSRVRDFAYHQSKF